MSNTRHDKLKAAAEKTLNDLHGDTSVSLESTMDSLIEMRDQASMLIDAVREDLARRE